ncbi:MAG TPA: YfiR family protein [Steroidobacteraceae bacterium]|nr:YfiR family protein [Steroidobacteraceae bacterium]
MKEFRQKHRGRGLQRTALAITGVIATLCLGVMGGLARAGDVYAEEAVKAAFLLRFTSYVTWPGKSTDTPFRIAVLGDKTMTARLRALVENRSVGGRPIEVNQIATVAEARDVHLLYIGNWRSPDLSALLAPLRARPILVVTDTADGLEAGSTINFLIADQRVRFEVSMEAARRAGLVISSELLSAAVRVQGGRMLNLLSRGQGL